MSEKFTIFIDGLAVEAQNGDTILAAAQRAGIDIPNLCQDRKITPTASCRLCIVVIEGRPGTHPSCAIKAEKGMKITAFSNELEAQRKMILDLMLSMHNDDCINCVMDGSCKLQDLAFKYDLGRNKRAFQAMWGTMGEYSDTSSQVLDYNAEKCIQCQRCVKACQEIQGKGILTLENRGLNTVVSTGYEKWNESRCDGCGECAQTCPTGALTQKNVYSDKIRFKSKDVEKVVKTTCPYCGVGCQLNVSVVKNTIVKTEGADDIPNLGSTCVKGRFGLDFANHAGRLTKPMIKKNGKLEECSWDEAISFTVSKLNDIRQKYGCDSIGGISSARCTNEDNYLMQKFIRAIVGTNNIDHCARLCHASTVAGLAYAFGSGAMTNPMSDFEKADVILVTGSNTTETHPVLANFIKRAVLFNKAKLIIVDPRKIDLVRYSTLWLKPRNGTDIAWINGFCNVILSENLHKTDFIRERTEGFETFIPVVRKYTPGHVEKITGIPAEKLIGGAKLFAAAPKASIAWTMGITQHSNGTDNVKALANLVMLTGNIGREGTGANPLRGQNNVQGACDMGAMPGDYPGYQKVADASIRSKFEKAWNCRLPSNKGMTLTEMMNAAHDGTLKAMYIMGENPLISDADSNHIRQGLESLEFLICQDIFLTETAMMADVVLPAKSSMEKYGTFTNTERRVLCVNQVIESPGESKDDWEIFQLLARATGTGWNYASWVDIMREINSVTPQYGGITPERIRGNEKLQWPCINPAHPGTPVLHVEKFARGKGLFSAVEHHPAKELPDKEYPYLMSTGRILFHYHTGTMTRKSKALNSFQSEAFFEMNSEDMAASDIPDGEKVKVYSRRGEIVISAKSSERIAPGNIFIPFHFTEAAANLLTINELDPVSKIPEFKVCAVNIARLHDNSQIKK